MIRSCTASKSASGGGEAYLIFFTVIFMNTLARVYYAYYWLIQAQARMLLCNVIGHRVHTCYDIREYEREYVVV